MYQAPSAPLSIGGVLDSGCRLFRECFTQAFVFSLVIALVSSPASSLAPYVAANANSPGFFLRIAGIVLAISIVALILTCAMLIVIDSAARGAPVSLGQALTRGVARAIPALVSYLLMMLAIVAIPFVLTIAATFAGITNPALIGALFVLLLIVPGSVIAIWLFFGPFASVLDGLGPVRGIRYSVAITRGHWWRTTGLLTVVFVILMVVYGVLGIASTVSAISDPIAAAQGQQAWYVQYLIGPLVSACGAPLMYSLFLATFYDLKLRHEGADLAARIAGAA
jgi:hypothetical protein